MGRQLYISCQQKQWVVFKMVKKINVVYISFLQTRWNQLYKVGGLKLLSKKQNYNEQQVAVLSRAVVLTCVICCCLYTVSFSARSKLNTTKSPMACAFGVNNNEILAKLKQTSCFKWFLLLQTWSYFHKKGCILFCKMTSLFCASF